MLEESLPSMLKPLEALRQSVGSGSPHENLFKALGGIFKFHQRIVSGSAGLFAEPTLLTAYRSSLAREGKGPHLSMGVLEEYILSEQRLARIDSKVDARLAAYLFMASSFFRAFNEQFFGKPMQPTWSEFAKQLIATVTPEHSAKVRK